MPQNFTTEEAVRITEAYVYGVDDDNIIEERRTYIHGALKIYGVKNVSALSDDNRSLFCRSIQNATPPEPRKPFPVVQVWAVVMIFFIFFLFLFLYLFTL